jgi:ectoine hydroxylase-related dioxygenase (phytanoyl-CoA dioxygenase family)
MGKPLGHFSSVNSFLWSDAFIVNFHRGVDQPWQPPSAQITGWHKDGSYFRHFLDSREQALLTIVLWSDMLHQGGATFIAPDSVRVVARYLYEHPEGVLPKDFDFQELIGRCTQFEEITGQAGDFIILHPFMLHASSQNVLGRPRFMSNPPIVLKESLNLNRANPADFSLLERATLHYLGLERLDFQPTHEREATWWPMTS